MLVFFMSIARLFLDYDVLTYCTFHWRNGEAITRRKSRLLSELIAIKMIKKALLLRRKHQ